MAKKLTYQQEIKKHNLAFTKAYSPIFQKFRKELKLKKISSISENNKLWNTKYKKKLDAIEKKFDKDYERLWKKHHSKK